MRCTSTLAVDGPPGGEKGMGPREIHSARRVERLTCMPAELRRVAIVGVGGFRYTGVRFERECMNSCKVRAKGADGVVKVVCARVRLLGAKQGPDVPGRTAAAASQFHTLFQTRSSLGLGPFLRCAVSLRGDVT